MFTALLIFVGLLETRLSAEQLVFGWPLLLGTWRGLDQ